MKKKFAIIIGLVMAFACFGLTACGDSSQEKSTQETEATTEAATEAPAVDGSAYGYMGDDPVEAAVYKYLVEDLAAEYLPEEGLVTVPVVSIIDKVENEDGVTDVYGDFWINNYSIEGDTLMTQSGGNHPGVIHVAKDGDTYSVTGFDQVQDGANFEPSAKEIFGDNFDAFMKVNSDDEATEAQRAKTLADFVKANGLEVTKYQDYGWDPVELEL